MIKVSNLTKKYKDKIVFDNVDLYIDKPSIIGIIGENGTGKTTLLKCMSNLICNYKGEIELVSSPTFSIENPSFFENISIKKNLIIFSKLIKNKTNLSVDDVLNYVGLKNDEKKLFKECSLGMKQKVMIARMILSDSKIFFMDEPFNALDVNAVKDLSNLILSLKNQGKIVVISSHILGELGELCDIVWHLKKNGNIEVIDLNTTYRTYLLKVSNKNCEKINEIDCKIVEEIEENSKKTFIIKIELLEISNFIREIVNLDIEIIEYKDITGDLSNYMVKNKKVNND